MVKWRMFVCIRSTSGVAGGFRLISTGALHVRMRQHSHSHSKLGGFVASAHALAVRPKRCCRRHFHLSLSLSFFLSMFFSSVSSLLFSLDCVSFLASAAAAVGQSL